MSKYPKILLASPTAEAKDYCLDEWAEYVKSLTYPNLDVFLVDNSKDPEHYKVIQSKGLPCIQYERQPGDEIRTFMTRCSNLIRDKILNEGYDFLFSLETDIFSASNIIEHLLMQRKKVVGLSYFLGQIYYSRLIPFEQEDFGYHSVTQTHPADKAFMAADGKAKKVHQLGLGCLLIHRSVLEELKFRYDPMDGELKGNADVYFHVDCQAKGIPVFCDWSNFAYHQNGNWLKIYDKYSKGKF